MNIKIRGLISACILAVFLCSPVFAENATVTYVRGKVEVQRQDGNWYPLSIGDVVEQSETISTGFYSDVKLEYNSSVIALGALTRVTLENLNSSSDKEDVSLYLNMGAVRSKVNHTKERRVSYVVKSPVAVASVRGTDFTITATGAVTCHEGAVVVFPNTERFEVTSASKSKKEQKSEDETEEEDVDEEEETPSETLPGDYESATATTAAKEIANDAPAGAIVVGKDQTVSITSVGTTETPIVNASKKTQQAKTVVTSAADQEVEVVGSAATTNQASAKEVTSAVENVQIKPGSITAEIELID